MLERLRPYDMPMGGTDGDPEPREVKKPTFLKSQILILRAKRFIRKLEKATYICQEVKDHLVRMGDLLKNIRV